MNPSALSEKKPSLVHTIMTKNRNEKKLVKSLLPKWMTIFLADFSLLELFACGRGAQRCAALLACVPWRKSCTCIYGPGALAPSSGGAAHYGPSGGGIHP